MNNNQYTTVEVTEELLQSSKLSEPLHLAAMLEQTSQSPLHGKAADCLRRMYAEAQPAPVQEPVAWVRWEWNRSGLRSLTFSKPAELPLAEEATGVVYDPLYTTPPAAQQDIQRLSALVRAQQITIDKLEAAQPAPVQEPAYEGEPDMHKYASQLEKRTFEMQARIDQLDFELRSMIYTATAQPEPVQEPVADAMARYLRVCSSGGMPKKLRESVQNLVYDAARLGYFKAATSPAAQRQWVYLTELEKAELWNRDTPIAFSYADAIEAKLKAKNFA